MIITSFNASARTVAFDNLDITKLALITNVTDNIVIYQFNKPSLGGVVAANILTLTYNTTGMSNTDSLRLDYQNSDAYGNTLVSLGTELAFEDSINMAARVEPTFKELSGLSTSMTTLNNILLPSTDVSMFSWISVAVTNSGWTGSVIAQFSNNGSEWYQSQWFNQFNYQSAQTITAGGLYSWPRFGRYFRMLVASTGTGTVSATAELYTLALSYWANGVSAFQSGNYNTRDGGTTSTQVTAGVAGNTVIKSSAGYLDKILVTTAGTSAMTIYDNATTNTGKIIAIVPANATAGTIVEVGLTALLGITISGNANNPAVTIGYN